MSDRLYEITLVDYKNREYILHAYSVGYGVYILS